MWKVGDRIRFIKNGSIDSTEEEGFKIGDIYEIVSRREIEYDDDGMTEELPEYLMDDYTYQIRHNDISWNIELDSFEKVVKKKAVKESDHLDNIRDNFRFGY